MWRSSPVGPRVVSADWTNQRPVHGFDAARSASTAMVALQRLTPSAGTNQATDASAFSHWTRSSRSGRSMYMVTAGTSAASRCAPSPSAWTGRLGEPGTHRQDTAVIVWFREEIELGQDVPDVRVDGLLRQVEAGSDGAVRASFGHGR